MSKRTNSIVAVTLAKYATVYVEADSPEEAMNLVEENKDEIYGELMSELDDQFEDSCIEVDSCEAYTTDVEDWMDYIWADGEAISYDEYMEELEEQEKKIMKELEEQEKKIMKELSIEEKARRYDEVIERAKNTIEVNRNIPDIVECVESLFPALKESEDERIRENIIATIHLYYGEPLEDEAKEMIAWLEKQGEQKIVEFKPSFRVGDVIKPKDPVLGEQRIIKGIHPKFGYDTNNGILDFEFEDNWELVEQKSAWSEEDESMYYGVIETEQYMLDVVNGIKEFNVGNISIKEECTKELNWLRTLKERYTWKPSDEQMIELRHVISGCSYNIEPLVEMEEQLKKRYLNYE